MVHRANVSVVSTVIICQMGIIVFLLVQKGNINLLHLMSALTVSNHAQPAKAMDALAVNPDFTCTWEAV